MPDPDQPPDLSGQALAMPADSPDGSNSSTAFHIDDADFNFWNAKELCKKTSELTVSAFPNIMSIMLLLLPEFINVFFISHYGNADNLAAIGLGNCLLNGVAIAVGIGINETLTTFVSTAHGAKRFAAMPVYLAQAQLICLVYAPFSMLILWNCEWIMLWLRQDPIVSRFAAEYCWANCFGVIQAMLADSFRKYFCNVGETERIYRSQLIITPLHGVWCWLLLADWPLGLNLQNRGLGFANAITWTISFVVAGIIYRRYSREFWREQHFEDCLKILLWERDIVSGTSGVSSPHVDDNESLSARSLGSTTRFHSNRGDHLNVSSIQNGDGTAAKTGTVDPAQYGEAGLGTPGRPRSRKSSKDTTFTSQDTPNQKNSEEKLRRGSKTSLFSGMSNEDQHHLNLMTMMPAGRRQQGALQSSPPLNFRDSQGLVLSPGKSGSGSKNKGKSSVSSSDGNRSSKLMLAVAGAAESKLSSSKESGFASDLHVPLLGVAVGGTDTVTVTSTTASKDIAVDGLKTRFLVGERSEGPGGESDLTKDVHDMNHMMSPYKQRAGSALSLTAASPKTDGEYQARFSRDSERTPAKRIASRSASPQKSREYRRTDDNGDRNIGNGNGDDLHLEAPAPALNLSTDNIHAPDGFGSNLPVLETLLMGEETQILHSEARGMSKDRLAKMYHFQIVCIWNREVWSWTAIRDFLRVGVFMTANVVAEWLFWEVIAVVAGLISPAALACHVAALNCYLLLFNIPIGLSVTIAQLVGEALGKGQPRLAKSYTILGLLFSAFVTVLLCLFGIWQLDSIAQFYFPASMRGMGDAPTHHLHRFGSTATESNTEGKSVKSVLSLGEHSQSDTDIMHDMKNGNLLRNEALTKAKAKHKVESSGTTKMNRLPNLNLLSRPDVGNIIKTNGIEAELQAYFTEEEKEKEERATEVAEVPRPNPLLRIARPFKSIRAVRDDLIDDETEFVNPFRSLFAESIEAPISKAFSVSDDGLEIGSHTAFHSPFLLRRPLFCRPQDAWESDARENTLTSAIPPGGFKNIHDLVASMPPATSLLEVGKSHGPHEEEPKSSKEDSKLPDDDSDSPHPGVEIEDNRATFKSLMYIVLVPLFIADSLEFVANGTVRACGHVDTGAKIYLIQHYAIGLILSYFLAIYTKSIVWMWVGLVVDVWCGSCAMCWWVLWKIDYQKESQLAMERNLAERLADESRLGTPHGNSRNSVGNG